MPTRNGVRIPLRDQLWLHMDRPDNLMYINSIVWFSEVPDWDAVTEAIETRMLEPYPVFRRLPVRRGRRWFWEDDLEFDISRQIVRSRLPAPGGRAEAEAHVSARMSVPLPDDRPLWSVELIEGYHEHGGTEEGAIILLRVQHGVVDGVRLTHLIQDLCDRDADAQAPAKVGRDLAPTGGGVVARIGHAGSKAARDTAGIARGLADAARRLPQTVTGIARDVRAPGAELTRVPTRLVESLSGVVDPTNTTVNTYRGLFRLLMEPKAPDLTWTGRAHARKKVSWVTGLDLEVIKSVAKEHDSTVTTVMLAAVSRALTGYLEDRGDRPVADVNLMVPMSVAPVDAGPADELGNHITLILLRLPLGIDDPQELLDAVTTSMTRVQHSFEPHVTYGAMLGVAAAPNAVSTTVIDVMANKAIGQFSSVPGPTSAVRLGGSVVEGMLGWVPMTGDQPLGICIYSYNGQVSVGVATDAELIPDPGGLARMVEGQFAQFAQGESASAPSAS